MSSINDTILAKFNPEQVKVVQANQADTYLLVDISILKEVIRFARNSKKLEMNYLSDISAVDYPKREKRFDVNYILYSTSKNGWLHIKTMISEEDTIESVTDIWEGAYYAETEVYDLFGISFKGNKFERRLFMPVDYQGFPLRKDFESPWEDITFK